MLPNSSRLLLPLLRPRCRAIHWMTKYANVSANPRTKKAGTIVFPPGSEKLPALPMEPPLYPDDVQTTKKGKAGMVNTKRQIEFRGEETVHNELYFDQYGIIAEAGGLLEPKHYATIRHYINTNMDPYRFAIWRVEPPWYSRTRKTKGMKRGGGKGRIHHFLLPIRLGRVIVEVGGYLDYTQAQAFLAPLADRMPFRARFVCAEELKAEKEMMAEIEANNQNPHNWEKMCRWNMLDSAKALGPWDWYTQGKMR